MEEELNSTPIVGIEYSEVPIKEFIDGFLVNRGKLELGTNFNNFDTHIYLCFEYSNTPILEEGIVGTEDTLISVNSE